MVAAQTAFTVGNTMIVAGVLLAIVLLLRAARRGQTRPEARLGGGISGLDRRLPRVPEPPEPRTRRGRRGREAEPTTIMRTSSATTARWSSRDATEPPPWTDPDGGDPWDAPGGR